MFLTDEETETRLSSVDNLVNRLSSNSNFRSNFQIKKLHNGGRAKGRKNDSNEDRLAVATHSIIHGPTSAAESFQTTPSRASLLSQGTITHHIGPDSELAPAVLDKKEVIHNKALDIIMASLESISVRLPEKATDLASIASDMARIAERTGGRLNPVNENKPQVNVVIYAPRVRDISEYDEVVSEG
jgi:hypothetical protein